MHRQPTITLTTAAAAALVAATGGADAQIALPDTARETASIVEPLDRVSLPVGVMTLNGDGTTRLEGRVLRQSFVLDNRGGTTPLALLEGAVDPLRRGGWDLVFDCVDSGCGGAVARFSLPLLAAPQMRLDTADMALATFRRGDGDDARWVTVIASRVLGEMYVQIVRVGAAGADEAIQSVTVSEPAAPEPLPDTPTRAGPATGSADADALFARLIATGHVPLAGVQFETGGARIAPGGESVLTAAGAMFETHETLRAAVVGHSDYSGDFDANMDLARARAEAVLEALVATGIERERLEVHSVGPLAPVASNQSAEGRAQNRRVELVLIP
ncbi:MAG: OmpA family protein [Pseudomonadota bacterium]